MLYLFGMLYWLYQFLPTLLGITLASYMTDLVQMLPYVVTVLVLIAVSMRKKKDAQPPHLGLPYSARNAETLHKKRSLLSGSSFCLRAGDSLVVLALQLKIALGMGAYRALEWGVLADIGVTAVVALPDLLGLAGVDLAGLDIGGQLLVAFLVLLFDSGHHRKPARRSG